MLIPFTKMQGLGNDFVVIDGTQRPLPINAHLIQQWSNRHFGIGFDQLLVVEAPRTQHTDFYYRIFNADGSEVEQCGNGARCFARFVRDSGLIKKDEITVETIAGIIHMKIEVDGQVSVDMGKPCLEPERIPFTAPQQAVTYSLEVNQQTVNVFAVSMGNPHCVLQVDDIKTAPVSTLGAQLSRHPCFPAGANVGFMEISQPNHIYLRVHERGTGETLACGSGACAAVVAGHLQGLLEQTVLVDLPGGRLTIHWPGPNSHIIMTGPATTVYQGEILIDDTD